MTYQSWWASWGRTEIVFIGSGRVTGKGRKMRRGCYKMAGLGTTENSAHSLVPSKPRTLNQSHATVLTLAISGKKSVAGVATLKPPKEDGGFFSAQFAFSRTAVAHCCLADSAAFNALNTFEYYYFLIP